MLRLPRDRDRIPRTSGETRGTMKGKHMPRAIVLALALVGTLTSGGVAYATAPEPARRLPAEMRSCGRGPQPAAAERGRGCADLAITKTGPTSVVAGDAVPYRITVTNNGPSPAADVVVTDDAPGTVTDATPSQGGCTPDVVTTCHLGGLRKGDVVTIELEITAPVPTSCSSPAEITNSATVTSAAFEPAPADNTATASTTVTCAADLAITKTGPTSVVAGDAVPYRVSVTNNGPSTAADVVMTDEAPGTITDATPSQGSCTTGTVAACRLGDLRMGDVVTITLEMTAPSPSSCSSPAEITNTATVTSATLDRVPGDNTAAASATVTCATDLTISQARSSQQPRCFQGADTCGLAVTITVTNNGPSAATDVVVAGTSAPSTSVSTAATTQGSCGTPQVGTFSCMLGSIAPGDSATITVELDTPGCPRPPLDITSTATVTGDTADSTTDNNTSVFSTVSSCGSTSGGGGGAR